MDKKRALILTSMSVMLVLGMVLVAVQPLPAGAANWINTFLARQPGAARSMADSLDGLYVGQVKLEYAVAGVYSDSLQPPSPGGEALPDLGAIDLALQLTQSESRVEGYIDLDYTLVFTTEHVVDATALGPLVSGSLDGSHLILESERLSLESAGRALMRQFRLDGNISLAEDNRFTGEYRETVWGYGLQPLTIVGSFDLAGPPISTNRPLYMPLIMNR